jgi:hypothetical protein
MVEQWPITAPGAHSEAASDGPVGRAPISAADRIAAVRADFFLDPALRLTEQERALMTAMLHGLVGSIADELRVRLPEDLARETDGDPDELVETLGKSGLLGSDGLLHLLLRQADSSRIAQAARAGGTPGGLLTAWSGDEDADLAGAAMGLIVARGRSRDRFGRAGVGLADCQADVAAALVHGVAAALALRSSVPVHDSLAAAASDLLSRHDEEQRSDALEARLIRVIESAGRLDPALVLALARHGEAGLMAEALARMAGISGDVGWCLAVQPGGCGLPLLLRLANQPRTLAAAVFVDLGEALGISDPAEAIDRFDAVSDTVAEAERRRLRLPDAYRAALAALGER